MQVSEVMHKGVISVQISDSIQKVAALMRAEDIGSVPVLDADVPVGFVTDRDIVITTVAEGRDLKNPISEAMSDEVNYVLADQDVKEASKIMAEKQVSRVLVLDQSHRPVGMVSLQDLAQDAKHLSGSTISAIKQ